MSDHLQGFRHVVLAATCATGVLLSVVVWELPTLARSRAQVTATPPKLSKEVLARIPEDLRDRFLPLVKDPKNDGFLEFLLAEEDPGRRRWYVLSVIGDHGSPSDVEFVFKQVDTVSPSRRATLISGLMNQGNEDKWRNQPRYVEFLLERLANETHIEPASVVLDIFRRLSWKPLPEVSKAIRARLEKEARAGNTGAVMSIGRLEERWQKYNEGLLVPAALQEAPPLFAVKEGARRLRILAFGDFGVGRRPQRETAAAMRRMHQKTKFDFGITTGDNFYTIGMTSTSDKVWKELWEDMYSSMGIECYASLGNHDWDPGSPDMVPAQILYTHKSTSWRMPATHYTYTAGPAQFFAINTQALSVAHLTWLRNELRQSKARWKIVYGHVPIYVSTPAQYDTLESEYKRLARAAPSASDYYRPLAELHKILEEGADLYVAGHHHSLQHLRPAGSKVHYLISGGGGASSYEVAERSVPGVLFASATYGFAVLDVSETEVTVRFVDTTERELYKHTIEKRP